MSSDEAVKEFEQKSIDMIFINGDDYESLENDIKSWLPIAKKMICGHDYQIPPVQAVINKFPNFRTIQGTTIWILDIE